MGAQSPVKLALGEKEKPWGVAINMQGEVIVTEHQEQKQGQVSVFSASGKKLQSCGSRGMGQEQVDGPCEVAIDAEGSILVVDNGNHRILKFTSDAQFLTTIGDKGSEPLQFNDPIGITFNASNSKLYVTENHRIQVLNSDLTFSSTFGEKGSGKGQFYNPHCIACDNTGNVFVADTYNNRIQVFTAEGEFVREFGKEGQGKGELSYPIGIAIDRNNLVYVGEGLNRENQNHRISVFTFDGGFVTSFGSYGKQPGQFNCPHALCVNSNNVVYVCDRDNNRIQCIYL